MAADNPYLEEWEKVRWLADSIAKLKAQVQEMQAGACELEARIANLPYDPDEDGDDRNESDRNYCYDRLYEIQSQISRAESMMEEEKADAMNMAGSYRQQAGEYQQRALHASNAGSGFQRLEGFRFGASAAKSGASLTGQRAAHYEDHAAVLNDLATSAEQAACGYYTGEPSANIRERGTLRIEKPDLPGGAAGENGNPYQQNNRSVRSTGGRTGKGIAAAAGLAWLKAEGLTGGDESGAELSQAAHGSVYMADSKVKGNITASHADAMLAGKWGMAQKEIREYRDENDLVWVKKRDTVELLPRNIAEEYGKKDILKENKAKLDGKKYYYDDNGILYRVENDLMPNSEYKLNGYRFRTDEQGRIVSAKGKLHLKERKNRLSIKDSIENIGKGDQKMGDDRGHLIADQFDGPSGMENLIPQDAFINRVDFKNYEGELAKKVEEGKDVRIEVEPIYEENSRRPIALIVVAVIDGEGSRKGTLFFNKQEEQEE